MSKTLSGVVPSDEARSQQRESVDDITDKQYPSRITKALHGAALTSLELFPRTWLKDDPSYLSKLQAEADRLRIWRNDYLCDDRLFDSFLCHRAPNLLPTIITTFCELLDAIVRAYYVFDDGSTLLAILSQYYPETPSMAEQQPTHLPRRPDYLRFTVDAIAKPKEVLIYVCGVMDLCFNNYVNSREILLGLTSMENQSPVRVWLEQMFQDQDENLSTASDLFEDIESSVKGLFETSCSLYWVPTRSFDNVVYKSSTSDSAIPSVQLIESLPPHLGMNLYNIAHQSTIEEAPAPEKDSETPKTRPTETSNALHVLIWHMLIVEPNSDAAVRLGDIQMAAGALRSYSIALDSVLKLVPQENLYPSTVLWGLITSVFDLVQKQRRTGEFRPFISAALVSTCNVLGAVHWRLRSYHENTPCRHFLSKSLSSMLSFWCDSWQAIQAVSRDSESQDHPQRDILSIASESLRLSLSRLERDMNELASWLFRNYADNLLQGVRPRTSDSTSLELQPDSSILKSSKIRLQVQLSAISASLSRQYFHGTLRWLSSESEISLWLQSPNHNRLCIHAPARSGKSIFAWYIAQVLVSERFWAGKGGPVTWFDCSTAKLKRTRYHAADAVESVVTQIVHKYCEERSGDFLGTTDHGVSSLVQQICTSHYRNLQNPETILYFKALLQALPHKPVHVVIDGIHEYPDNQACFLLDFLDNFTAGPPLLKLLVTGQQVGHLAMRCQSGAWASSNCLKYEIPLQRLQKDIASYIDTISRLRKEMLGRPGKGLGASDTIQDLLALVSRLANTTSVFTWAGLIKQQILSSNSSQELDQLLLPGSQYFKSLTSLKSLYLRFLVQLEWALLSRNSDLLSSIPTLMMWVTCSRRPLTLAQAFEVFKLCYPDKDPSDKDSAIQLNFGFRSALARLKPLLRIESPRVSEEAASAHPRTKTTESDESSILRWVDPSFGDFLISQEKSEFARSCKEFITVQDLDTGVAPTGRLLFAADDAHAKLFQTCLSSLARTLRCGQNRPFGVRGSYTTAEQFRNQNPLLEYAACLWHYHITQVSSRDQAFMCMTKLDDFLRSPESRKWMEVAITLQDSVEWLFTVKFMLSRWAKKVEHPNFMGELPWVKDISGQGFREYEMILPSNPSEVHFTDASLLLPGTARNDAGRDRVIPTRWTDDIPGERIPSLFDFRATSCQSQWKDVSGTAVPDQLVSGENANNECGFLCFDMNQGDGERGVFLIDRLCNHPRLMWECFGQARKRLGKSLSSTAMKEDHHSLWKTLSASLSPDGTSVVAVFTENLPGNKRSRVKVIVWEFHASDDNSLISWKTKYAHALDSGDASQQKTLLKSRPLVPSTEPLETGAENDWADALDVWENPEILPQNWPLEATRYLAAFKGESSLVTFRGLVSLDTQEYEQHFSLPAETLDAAIAPGGMYILRIPRERPNVLEVWSTDTFSVSRRILNRDVDEGLLFSGIIDFSPSGKLVALSMHDQSGARARLVVLSLDSWAISTVYRHSDNETRGVSVTRAYFCEQGNHLAFFLRQELSLGRQYSVWALSLGPLDDQATNTLPSVARLDSLESQPVGVLFPGHDRCHDTTNKAGNEAKVAVFDGDRLMTMWGIPKATLYGQGALIAAVPKSPEILRPSILSQRSVCSTSLMSDGRARVTAVFLTMTCLAALDRPPKNDQVFKHTGRAPLAVSVTIRWGTWNLCLKASTPISDDPERSRCGSRSYNLSIRHSYCRSGGMALGPGLETFAWWVGSQIHFVRVGRGHYGAVQEFSSTADEGSKIPDRAEDCVCQSATFSPSERFCLSIWAAASPGDGAEPGTTWAFMHELDLDGLRAMQYAPLRLSSLPTNVTFHSSRNLVVVTLDDGGVLVLGFDYSADPNDMFKKNLSKFQIETWLAIREQTNTQPSPRSTGKEGGAGRLDLRFSTCGDYLYSQGWHVFALVQDLFQSKGVPAGTAVLKKCFMECRKETMWKRPPDSHPLVLEEDVLYGGKQHRYKVFRVRDYLVLGWSADPMSFFRPEKQLVKPTWYRRVICAIPQTISAQKAVVLWPSDPELCVAAVFFTDIGVGKPILPTAILSPLKGSAMSVSGEMDEGRNFVDGWLRGHAFGCPYHLKS